MAFQGDSIFWVEVEKVVPNPFQPRREFDEQKLKELSESVRMYGILQPLTVTRREIQNEDGSFRSEYELIAGERRLRASKLAGLVQVPVIIREGEQSEQEKLELAIIENLQREDLNAVDRAIAFRQLADVFGLSHSQVAVKVGRSREYVSNSIRLLALPDYMLNSVKTGDISEGHARTLLMLNDRPEEQDTLFREILLKKLSVREVERIARGIATEKIRKKETFDADLLEMEKKFTETLGTRVSIVKTEFGGRLSIDYFTQEDLEEMLESMRREAKKISTPTPVEPTPMPTSVGPVNVPGALGNPRADELAILTEKTGLELVEENKVADEKDMSRPWVPVPAASSADVDAEDSPTVATETQLEEIALEDNIPEEVLMTEREVNQVMSGEEPESVMVTETQVEYIPKQEEEVIEVASEIVHESAGLIQEPVASAPVAEIASESPVTQVQNVNSAQTVAPAKGSLRDQLASLLGGNKHVGMSASAPTVVPKAEAPASPVANVIPTEKAKVEPVPQVASQDDDSDLYSIKDFSI